MLGRGCLPAGEGDVAVLPEGPVGPVEASSCLLLAPGVLREECFPCIHLGL